MQEGQQADKPALGWGDGGAVVLPPPRVLIVDDLPANLLAFDVALEPLGYHVVRAESGRQALRQLLRQDFSLLLMDVQMPDLNGIDTVRLIKQSRRHRDIPILLITAACKDIWSVLQGYEAGAVDYILKPCDPAILRSKVTVLVELTRQKEIIKRQAALICKHEREAIQRRCEHRYQSLIEAMPICVWNTHPNGRFHYSNRVWLQYAGACSEQNVGWGLWRSLHPADRRRVAAAWRRALGSGHSVELQARLRRRDGAYLWHIARAVPQQDEGRITGWIITATDIDEQKRAEEAERLARKEAEAANGALMKDEFLATLSHELRTPLTAIVGWTHLLRSGTLDSERAERGLEVIARNVEKEQRLVEEILDASRIAKGRLLVRLDPIDPAIVIHAAVEALRPLAKAKHITFESTVKSTGALMMGDSDRLWQLTAKLVLNALKFTPPGGRVEIGFEHHGHGFTLTVADSGEGIRPEVLPRVFGYFSHEDCSPSRKHGGLGLGLAIVRRLVELHGGKVCAASAGKGHGATFTVELPSCATPATPARREPQAMEESTACASW